MNLAIFVGAKKSEIRRFSPPNTQIPTTIMHLTGVLLLGALPLAFTVPVSVSLLSKGILST